MKTILFKKTGWFYFPVSLFGWIIVLSLGIFMTTVILAADRNAHSVSDMLYSIFPYAVCCFYILNWAGENSSE